VEVKPAAGLSLDLDNKWSYMKTHGDPGWQSFPSYLPLVVPRVLGFLAERKLRITFFLVGEDATRDENQGVLRAIAGEGHDVGNHSFRHEPWLHLYSEAELEEELAKAEEAIDRATGRRPKGFRGPGFSLSRSTLKVLMRRGYQYDASTLPTYLGPLARAYYFLTSRLDQEQKEQRKALFGHFSDGLRSVRPYRWVVDGQTLLEVPVTTMPLLKLPIHVSYVLYLSVFSRSLALLYFNAALRACRLTGTPVSLLLHPLDFLGAEDEPDLSFFPAMGLASRKKVEIVSDCLEAMGRHFEVLSLDEHCQRLSRSSGLSTVAPDFREAQLPITR